jgi:RNA polymerase sigma-54 factor
MPKQSLNQKLLQKLSPQQIKLMKLIQLSTLELENRIDNELTENPALESENISNNEESGFEEDYTNDLDFQERDVNLDQYISDDEIPNYKLYSQSSYDNEEQEIILNSGKNLFEILNDQLREHKLSEKDYEIGYYIIGCINDDGYLNRKPLQICDDLVFSKNLNCNEQEVLEVLTIIQSFDPPGVAARDLKESLIIQLKKKEKKSEINLAVLILEDHFEIFVNKHYEKLCNKLQVDINVLKSSILEIEKLNPKPAVGLNYSSHIQSIIPDFTVQVDEEDRVEFTLNSRNAPVLKISKDFQNLISLNKEKKGDISKENHQALLFAKQKLDSARWFINAIQQRQKTLILTMSAIVKKQKNYFISGDEKDLRPMILKDIATEISMDISTVSRVINSKYVETLFGVFSLKHFFSESMTKNDGESISTKEIKNSIREIITSENSNKPINDQSITETLKSKGYNIARRTVAKYREQMGFPVARLRKKITD